MATDRDAEVELLTEDDAGHAVEGLRFPGDLGVVAYAVWDGDPPRLAYPHKFFRYDEHDRPMPETLVDFLVPSYLLRGGFPTQRACELVVERMGWRA